MLWGGGDGVPDNYFGAPGATAIAEALKSNTTITSVDLNGECRACAAMLMLTAATLGYTVNCIGAEGTAAIAESLILNTALTSVNLRCEGARGRPHDESGVGFMHGPGRWGFQATASAPRARRLSRRR